MKKHIYYEIELTDEQSNALDDAHEYAKLCVIEDPWRTSKKELVEGWISDLIEDEYSVPDRIVKLIPHLKAVLEQVKDFKDDDEVLMVIGL